MIKQKTSFTIIGGGTAGWLSALALAHHSELSQGEYQINLIEPTDSSTIGVGEATTDSFIPFLESLNVDINELIIETGASFKQTILFKEWGSKDHLYWHPFYEKSLPLPFVLDILSSEIDFNDCFLNVTLAKKNKTPFLGNKRLACGLHFDNFLLAKYLKKISIKRGLNYISAKVLDFEIHEDHKVASVVLDNGQHLTSDFFLDCSGFQSILLGGRLQTTYNDFLPYLMNNRAFAIQLPYETGQKRIDPYTTAHALDCGWSWRIPIQERIGTGYVFSDKYITPDQAESEFRQKFMIPKHIPGRSISIRVGHYEEIFRGNCLGVGLSSGFIEPLESTGILFITKVLDQLKKFLDGRTTKEKINKYMADYYVSTRDFLFLHYKLTSRTDTAYWRDASNLPFPETLKEKWALFSEIKLGSNDEKFADKLKKACDPWDPKAFLFILNGMNFFDSKVPNHPYTKLINQLLEENEKFSETFQDNTQFLEDLKATRVVSILD